MTCRAPAVVAFGLAVALGAIALLLASPLQVAASTDTSPTAVAFTCPPSLAGAALKPPDNGVVGFSGKFLPNTGGIVDYGDGSFAAACGYQRQTPFVVNFVWVRWRNGPSSGPDPINCSYGYQREIPQDAEHGDVFSATKFAASAWSVPAGGQAAAAAGLALARAMLSQAETGAGVAPACSTASTSASPSPAPVVVAVRGTGTFDMTADGAINGHFGAATNYACVNTPSGGAPFYSVHITSTLNGVRSTFNVETKVLGVQRFGRGLSPAIGDVSLTQNSPSGDVLAWSARDSATAGTLTLNADLSGSVDVVLIGWVGIPSTRSIHLVGSWRCGTADSTTAVAGGVRPASGSDDAAGDLHFPVPSWLDPDSIPAQLIDGISDADVPVTATLVTLFTTFIAIGGGVLSGKPITPVHLPDDPRVTEPVAADPPVPPLVRAAPPEAPAAPLIDEAARDRARRAAEIQLEDSRQQLDAQRDIDAGAASGELFYGTTVRVVDHAVNLIKGFVPEGNALGYIYDAGKGIATGLGSGSVEQGAKAAASNLLSDWIGNTLQSAFNDIAGIRIDPDPEGIGRIAGHYAIDRWAHLLDLRDLARGAIGWGQGVLWDQVSQPGQLIGDRISKIVDDSFETGKGGAEAMQHLTERPQPVGGVAAGVARQMSEVGTGPTW